MSWIPLRGAKRGKNKRYARDTASLKRGFDKSGSEIILNIFFVCVSFTGTTNKALQLLFLDNTIWKLKTGIPTDEELQRLAHDIPEDWKRIGRAVGLKEKHLRIIEIDKADDVCERALATLYKWKEKQGQEATYTRLALALDDSLVQRRDLVEEYCCDVFPSKLGIESSLA